MQEKDLNILTLDEIEGMEEAGAVEIELNDGEVKAINEITASEAEKIKRTIKAMSEMEQEVAVTAIKDTVLWEEMHRRYLVSKDKVRRAFEALAN